MRNHGGLKEIIATKQAPAGFVRQDSGDITSTQAVAFKKSAEFIKAKKEQRLGGWRKCFTKIATGDIADDVKLTQRRFDGHSDWVNNKDALRHLNRIGHPLVRMNPALLGEAAG